MKIRNTLSLVLLFSFATCFASSPRTSYPIGKKFRVRKHGVQTTSNHYLRVGEIVTIANPDPKELASFAMLEYNLRSDPPGHILLKVFRRKNRTKYTILSAFLAPIEN